MGQHTTDPAPERRGHRYFAAFWEFASRGMERGAMGKMRRELLRDIRGDVLEIGAGTGANFAHYPPEARVIAIEPDPHMRKRAPKRMTPNIDLRDGAAERLPVPDASCDAVVTTLVLCSVDDVPAALAEIRRVLRPGGELRFLEHVRGGAIVGRFQDLTQPVYGHFSGNCRWNRRTEQALRDAGFAFTRLEHRRITGGTPAIFGVAQVAG